MLPSCILLSSSCHPPPPYHLCYRMSSHYHPRQRLRRLLHHREWPSQPHMLKVNHILLIHFLLYLLFTTHLSGFPVIHHDLSLLIPFLDRQNTVCGKPRAKPRSRIIGGQDAFYGEFPWQVSDLSLIVPLWLRSTSASYYNIF